MLSKQVKELGATLGVVIQSCGVTCNEVDVTNDAGEVIGTEIVCDDIV